MRRPRSPIRPAGSCSRPLTSLPWPLRGPHAFGLRTEASSAFERGCDPEGIDRAVRRLCEMLAQIGRP